VETYQADLMTSFWFSFSKWWGVILLYIPRARVV
jgi:hypothetical protein